jgi:hypothetical protein
LEHLLRFDFAHEENHQELKSMMYWIGIAIPTIILLAALIYAVIRAGWFSRREERQLDANTRTVQRRDDPQ